MSTNYIRTLSRGWLIIKFLFGIHTENPEYDVLARCSEDRVAKCFLRTVIVLSRKATYILPHKRNNVRYILLEESILLKNTYINVARLVRWWTGEKTRSRVFGVTSAKQRKCLPLALYTPLHTHTHTRIQQMPTLFKLATQERNTTIKKEKNLHAQYIYDYIYISLLNKL